MKAWFGAWGVVFLLMLQPWNLPVVWSFYQPWMVPLGFAIAVVAWWVTAWGTLWLVRHVTR